MINSSTIVIEYVNIIRETFLVYNGDFRFINLVLFPWHNPGQSFIRKQETNPSLHSGCSSVPRYKTIFSNLSCMLEQTPWSSKGNKSKYIPLILRKIYINKVSCLIKVILNICRFIYARVAWISCTSKNIFFSVVAREIYDKIYIFICIYIYPICFNCSLYICMHVWLQ